MNRINDWLALHITKLVGTMYCAYLFTALAFVSARAAFVTHNPTIIVNWLSSNFLQLVLLPIIMVGQQIQADQTIKHVTKKHEELKAHIAKMVK